MKYRFVYAEDGPPADLKVVGYGLTEDRALEQVALGMMNAIVPLDRISSITMITHRKRLGKGHDIESAMFDFFDNLLSFFEDEGLVWKTIKPRLNRYTIPKTIEITASVTGEHFDREKHKPEMNIKAVTFHQMALEDISDAEHGRCWRATVVFDL